MEKSNIPLEEMDLRLVEGLSAKKVGGMSLVLLKGFGKSGTPSDLAQTLREIQELGMDKVYLDMSDISFSQGRGKDLFVQYRLVLEGSGIDYRFMGVDDRELHSFSDGFRETVRQKSESLYDAFDSFSE